MSHKEGPEPPASAARDLLSKRLPRRTDRLAEGRDVEVERAGLKCIGPAEHADAGRGLLVGKRRGELRRQSDTTRKVLKYYNNDFLVGNMNICLTLAIVFYSLWTADAANAQTHLIWTVPLVICLCLKYYLTIDGNSDGDPIEVIFQDKVLLGLIAAFAMLTVVLLYLV